MKTLRISTLITCLLALSLPSWAATYTQVVTGSFGTGLTGQAANVRLTVYDSAGTVQIAATNAPNGNTIAESTDAGATANTGVYIARFTCDTAWLPIHFKMTIVGQTGVSASAIIGSDRAASLADGYTATRGANLSNLDAASSAIKAKTDIIATNAADSPNQAASQGNVTTIQSRLGSPVGLTFSADIAAIYARLGTPAGASTSADIAAVLSSVNGLPSASANATAVWGAGSRTLSAFAFQPTVGGYATGMDPAAQVLNATAASYNVANSIGAKINAAGSASDPWATALPGAYGAGSAGYILGTNLNATVASRLATNGYTAPTNPTDYARNNVAPSWYMAAVDPFGLTKGTYSAGTWGNFLGAQLANAVPTLPTDYLTTAQNTKLTSASTAQQAGSAVTLPTTPPAGYALPGYYYAPVLDSGTTATAGLVVTVTNPTSSTTSRAISWTADSTAIGYKVLRSTNGVNYTVIATLAAGTTTYTDNARPSGDVYYSVIARH